jgi:2-octaprenyl-6-methoxyphenol hydroxylase
MPDVAYDVAVVGAGPAGLLAALCCSAMGVKAAVVGPYANSGDGRTAALFGPSVSVLRRLGMWDTIEPRAASVRAIRLIDATPHVVHAPEVLFQASEIGLDEFGFNVPNEALTTAFEEALKDKARRIETTGVATLEAGSSSVRIVTAEGGAIETQLVIAADGRQSFCRAAAGIGIKSWSYDQSAIVSTFAHSRPHGGVSTEFHRKSGPLTLVPGPGRTSSLVWVEAPDQASRIAALDDEAFLRELENHIFGLLGKLSAPTPRRLYPIAGQSADRLASKRVALIGEAAHVLPPIGAQGLNLSFRDAATIAEIAGAAKRDGSDAGGGDVLAKYEDARRVDTTSRAWGIDFLNRSLLSPWPGTDFARGLGLFAVSKTPPLKSFLMRAGIMPMGPLPDLMQPAVDRVQNKQVLLDDASLPRA